MEMQKYIYAATNLIVDIQNIILEYLVKKNIIIVCNNLKHNYRQNIFSVYEMTRHKELVFKKLDIPHVFLGNMFSEKHVIGYMNECIYFFQLESGSTRFGSRQLKFYKQDIVSGIITQCAVPNYNRWPVCVAKNFNPDKYHGFLIGGGSINTGSETHIEHDDVPVSCMEWYDIHKNTWYELKNSNIDITRDDYICIYSSHVYVFNQDYENSQNGRYDLSLNIYRGKFIIERKYIQDLKCTRRLKIYQQSEQWAMAMHIYPMFEHKPNNIHIICFDGQIGTLISIDLNEENQIDIYNIKCNNFNGIYTGFLHNNKLSIFNPYADKLICTDVDTHLTSTLDVKINFGNQYQKHSIFDI